MERNAHILYYDCTNYYFEIEQEDGDKKYGKSKEHRPNPIIQMGLFTDGDGIPLENGLKLIRRKMAVSRHLQKKVLEHLLDTPNVYYRSTIADGINGFFKLYRPQFSAHEIHITADYPVFMGRPELGLAARRSLR